MQVDMNMDIRRTLTIVLCMVLILHQSALYACPEDQACAQDKINDAQNEANRAVILAIAITVVTFGVIRFLTLRNEGTTSEHLVVKQRTSENRLDFSTRSFNQDTQENGVNISVRYKF